MDLDASTPGARAPLHGLDAARQKAVRLVSFEVTLQHDLGFSVRSMKSVASKRCRGKVPPTMSELRRILFCGLVILPAFLPYVLNFVFNPKDSVSFFFIQYDQPYYFALAREYFD
ncbi:MAG TPA: hypothetical protein VJ952_11655, partial [Opitutales bacterium]|nr:hypothetical protein [Opitutales bacterium]